ncbi:hypothetical protein [Micromonospora sp. NBC_01813]|uniref:hypothetical protein n=1 Tax=Micromonospora sp. NBC_01813 TaxID=2975988 RepID=UPI002DDAC4CE|nr:hypothetical protein [Micromonospora sp. NBC_01813]WSA11527.1 hypothetical protein OG958_12515 [Micromonospora sp. NBC_01813]
MKKTFGSLADLLAPLGVGVATAAVGIVFGWMLRDSRPAEPMQPCAAEDSAAVAGEPCYFNATERGNGRGVSFVIDGTGRAIFLPSNP